MVSAEHIWIVHLGVLMKVYLSINQIHRLKNENDWLIQRVIIIKMHSL
ncbi:hypothetical protein THOM_0008 [Trachipleistophora hominis]|uniref:Uncharacterized protein n=1 Tax=Trachipleistophora hominis TaxID=72359 RepID=L7K0F2_TRAHO|nr:hypothetical protein THOM_0008 [Trachipleistophora hominis]